MKKSIDAFIHRADREGLPVEAVMAYQGDTLIAEHHWVADKPRNIYSHTKSYMSTAVGLAIGDGLLSLDDRPADFFPDALPQNADPALGSITLRHLLMMSSGFDESLLMMNRRVQSDAAPDYARYVLSHTPKCAPGSAFRYSNGDSYLAGRMVEARVGRTLRDYLNERLFAPLEIPFPQWEHCPLGHTFGASGLYLRIGDMMKLGRLYLRQGQWKGRQLLSPEWIREATSRQIDTPHDSPWKVGYGYQFWLSPYPGAYRAAGMCEEITTVLPAADAVVAIQCSELNTSDSVLPVLHEEVLSRLA